jgi:hypothetical protein
MKKYEIILTANYEKTICVYADSPEQAKEKMETILFDTDLITFSDEDFVSGEADITDPCEENVGESVCSEDDGCSDCPYYCPLCGECMYGDVE